MGLPGRQGIPHRPHQSSSASQRLGRHENELKERYEEHEPQPFLWPTSPMPRAAPSRTLDSVASIQPLRQGRDSLVFPQINYSWCLRQQKGRLRSSQSASTILPRVPAEPAVTPLAKSHPRPHQTSSPGPEKPNAQGSERRDLRDCFLLPVDGFPEDFPGSRAHAEPCGHYPGM